MLLLLLLVSFLLGVLVIAGALLVLASQPQSYERPELIAVGNVTVSYVEGDVVGIGDSSVTIASNKGDMVIYCPTKSSLWMKSKMKVGDHVRIAYHVSEAGETTLTDVKPIDARGQSD